MIVGDKYSRREIYNSIYEYKADEGYHFESEGCIWGRVIYGGDKLDNYYIIKKDEVNTKENSK